MQSGSPRAGIAGVVVAVLLYIGVIGLMNALDAFLTRDSEVALAGPTAPAPPPAPPVTSAEAEQAAAPARAPARPHVTLTVTLNETTRDAPGALHPTTMNVARFWPELHEAPLPEGELAEVLEEVLALELHQETAQLPAAQAELLRMAAAGGLSADAPPEAAWEAVLLLEIERRRGEAAWLAQRSDAGWRKDTAAAFKLATDVAAANEGTLEGDIAELYALHALADPHAETYDPDEAVDAALNLLHFTEDFAVMEAAADLLSGVSDVPTLNPGDVDQLEGIYGEVEDQRVADGLGRLLLDQAVAHGDGALGAEVLTALETLGEATCPEGDDSAPCARRRSALAAAEGLLAVKGGEVPARWRAALAAAAWRCHQEGAPLDAPLTGQATWNDGWTWTAWTPATSAFEACLLSAVADAPGPEVPSDLIFTVVPPTP